MVKVCSISRIYPISVILNSILGFSKSISALNRVAHTNQPIKNIQFSKPKSICLKAALSKPSPTTQNALNFNSQKSISSKKYQLPHFFITLWPLKDQIPSKSNAAKTHFS